MNEKMLYENFVRYAEDTIKEKDLRSHSFDARLGYKYALNKLILSLFMIQRSYQEASEYSDKFLELYENLDSFYNSLNATEEWN